MKAKNTILDLSVEKLIEKAKVKKFKAVKKHIKKQEKRLLSEIEHFVTVTLQDTFYNNALSGVTIKQLFVNYDALGENISELDLDDLGSVDIRVMFTMGKSEYDVTAWIVIEDEMTLKNADYHIYMFSDIDDTACDFGGLSKDLVQNILNEIADYRNTKID